MKKHILFSFTGGLILFIWQFLSFAMPNFHSASMQYTPMQDSILRTLEQFDLNEGMYLLGQADPTLPYEQQEKAMNDYVGKPWASLNYQFNNSMVMTLPMLRGIITCILAAFMLFWIFSQLKNPSLLNRIWTSLAVGLIAFFFIPYSNFIWFREPDIWAYFTDAIIPWLILAFLSQGFIKQRSSQGKL